MSSTAAFNGKPKIAPNDTDNPFSPPLRPSSRRTPSFSSSSPSLSSSSSSSSSSSFHHGSPLFSPSTPLRSFSGIPFSWEKLPGIPKKPLSKKQDPSLSLLPLPPAGTPPPPSSKKLNSMYTHQISPLRKKYSTTESFMRESDPFFAALVECSKDDHDDDHDHDDDQPTIGSFNLWKSSKATRTLSDRFGFINMYTSCKSTCPVSDSIIYMPRSGRSSYQVHKLR